MMLNARGSLLIGAILLLPFVVAVLSFASASLFLMSFQSGSERSCLLGVLQAQELLIAANQKVLDLNPHAWRLILEKRALREAMKRAGPKAAVILAARLKQVTEQQIQLRTRQQTLLYQGEASAQAALRMAKSKILKHQASHLAAVGLSPTRHLQVRLIATRSALQPILQDIAPPYVRGPGHSARQKISLHWRIHFRGTLPVLLGPFLKGRDQWQESCSSRPLKQSGGPLWQPIFKRDKVSLSAW